MERKILTAKKPSRRLAALQSHRPAGQTEATMKIHHERTKTPEEKKPQQSSLSQSSPLPSQPQQPPEPSLVQPQEIEKQTQSPPAQQSNPQPGPAPAPSTPPTPAPRNPPPHPIGGLHIGSASQARSKAKEAIQVPETPVDLEAQWAKLFVENIQQRATIHDQEAMMASQASTIESQSKELKEVRVQSARSTPRLAALEMAVSDTESQISLLETEAGGEADRAATADHERLNAQREATHLRRVNRTLLNHRSEERGRIAHLKTLLARMKDELDSKAEESVRAAVLGAENAKLRTDLAAGMEQMRLMLRSQQELVSELNEEGRRAAEEAWDAKKQGENLGALGIDFRGESIWDGSEAGSLPAPAGGAEAEVGVEVASRGTQTLAPPSALSPIFFLAAIAPAAAPIPSPLPPPPESITMTITAPTATATATSGHSTGTQTEEEEEVILPTNTITIPNERITHTSFLPSLLFLLAAFFFALHANRLAAEREVWAVANDAVRGFTTGWDGGEWWSGVLGERVGWEVEVWTGVERRLLG